METVETLLAAETVWGIPSDVFGAWGQWAGAVATFAAVVVALWVAFSDGRRRAREVADRRAAQARTITARVDLVSGETDERVLRAGWSNQWQAVVVENHGLLPVTDVVIHSVAAREDGQLLRKWRLREGQTTSEHVDQSDYALCAVVGPGSFHPSPVLDFAERDNEDTRWVDSRAAWVDFSFLDAEGLRWRRVGNGRPERVASPYGELLRGDHYYLDRRGRRG